MQTQGLAWRILRDEQLARAKARVREHMTKSGSELLVWGRIQRYLFCYAENKVLVLSPDGEVLKNASGDGLVLARITLKGKPLPPSDNGGNPPT